MKQAIFNYYVYWVLCAIIISSMPALSQERYQFEHFSNKQGLSQSDVRAIVQDASGFLWMATEDGLNRYDGNQFRIFRNDPFNQNSLSTNYLTTLATDKAGNVWVGTDGGGLCRYDPITESFQRFLPTGGANALQSNYVASLFVAEDGVIWIGTYQGGLSFYNPRSKQITNALDNPNFPSLNKLTTVSAILKDAKGKMWFGTLYDGLMQYDIKTGETTHYTKDKVGSLCSNYVITLAEDDRGNIWAGTNAGISVINPTAKKITNYIHAPYAGSISSNYIYSIKRDSQNKIWVATNDGLNLFDANQKKFTFLKHNPEDERSLSDDDIRSIYQDRSGVLWFGTRGNGVNKLIPSRKAFYAMDTFFPDLKSLNGQEIKCILQDSKGGYWFGTTRGVYYYNKLTHAVRNFRAENSRGTYSYTDHVWALAEGPGDFIWAATEGGLLLIEKKTQHISRYTNTSTEERYLTNILRSLYVQGDSLLWVGTYAKGFYRFNIKSRQYTPLNFTGYDFIKNHTVHKFLMDDAGNLWICSTAGICKFRPASNTMTFFFNRHGKYVDPTDECITIHQAKKGILWLGLYGGGLLKFSEKDGVIKRFTTSSGLSNNSIMGFLPAGDSVLWIATMEGLDRFSYANENFENYSPADGLDGISPWVNSCWKSKDNHFLIGYSGGMSIFNPDSIVKKTSQMPIVITNFLVLNKKDTRYKNIVPGMHMSFPYSENFLSFEYACPDYSNPNAIQYKYKLEGFDKDWIEAGTRKFVSFSNILPGDYTLLIKSTNSDGVWNKTPFVLYIRIIPPFYNTWWFRLLAALVLLFTSYLIVKKRLSNLQRENLAQQRYSRQLVDSIEAGRKRIASELHDGIGQNLLIINNRAKMALKAQTADDTKNQITIISDIALESINDVRNLAFELHPYQIEEAGLTRTIITLIKRISNEYNFRLEHSIDHIDGLLPSEKGINIYRIIQESLNNIIKHAKAEQVTITIHHKKNMVRLKISDNGVGMTQDEINKNLRGSKGFGIKGMQERALAIGGKFQVRSAHNKGTSLFIDIPVEPVRGENNGE